MTGPRDPSPHATGYEDAITRRIAGLEARVAGLEADLARERAQAQSLLEDNARLRGRAAQAERTLDLARRVRLWTVVVAVVVGAAAVAAALFVLRSSPQP